METETLLTVLLIIILFEYIFRLHGEVEKRAEKKFQKWREDYLAGEAKKPQAEATSGEQKAQ